MSGRRPTEARIHLDAIRANLAAVRRAAGTDDVIAVVKADAYGHGAPAVAGALAGAGCRRFAVVSVEEAAALRKSGRGEEILVLGGVHDPEEAEAAAALGVTPVVHHRGHLELLAGAAQGRPLAVHVEVDTGMRRMGVPEAEAVELLEGLAAEPALRLAGVYTHPARADEADPEPTREQLRRFAAVLDAARARGIDPGLVHWANSAAALSAAELAPAAPPAGALRVGLALYGAQPAPTRRADLRPTMTLATRVVQVRDVAPGEAVGYGGAWRAERPTRVATLALGYSDGLPRRAGNRARVAIGEASFPVVGRISMDFTGVDVGDSPVRVGDEARVFGAGAATPTVEALAEAADTIAYEILVGVGARVPRVVVEDDG